VLYWQDTVSVNAVDRRYMCLSRLLAVSPIIKFRHRTVSRLFVASDYDSRRSFFHTRSSNLLVASVIVRQHIFLSSVTLLSV